MKSQLLEQMVCAGNANSGNKFIDWEPLFDIFTEQINQQYKLLEEQFKAELSKINFRGEITPKKVKRHGFKYIHHQEVGIYITKNGIRVTDIFFKPTHWPDQT